MDRLDIFRNKDNDGVQDATDMIIYEPQEALSYGLHSVKGLAVPMWDVAKIHPEVQTTPEMCVDTVVQGWDSDCDFVPVLLFVPKQGKRKNLFGEQQNMVASTPLAQKSKIETEATTVKIETGTAANDDTDAIEAMSEYEAMMSSAPAALAGQN